MLTQNQNSVESLTPGTPCIVLGKPATIYSVTPHGAFVRMADGTIRGCSLDDIDRQASGSGGQTGKPAIAGAGDDYGPIRVGMTISGRIGEELVVGRVACLTPVGPFIDVDSGPDWVGKWDEANGPLVVGVPWDTVEVSFDELMA